MSVAMFERVSMTLSSETVSLVKGAPEQYLSDQFLFLFLMFSVLRFSFNRPMYVTGEQWKGHKRLPVLRHVRQMQLPGRQTCGVRSSSGWTFSYEEN